MRDLFLATLSAILLSLPAQGQDKKAAPEVRKESAEPKIKWDGEWKLLAEDSDQVETLIDEHLKDLNFAKRAWWKRKLQASCKAYTMLDILAGDGFSVTLGKEVPADAVPGGGSSDWKRSDGEKFQVSMKQEGPRITMGFQGDGYTLTLVFSMRKNGRTLALQTTYAHPSLESPFSYKLVFQRED
jgi:hypothetical protein